MSISRLVIEKESNEGLKIRIYSDGIMELETECESGIYIYPQEYPIIKAAIDEFEASSNVAVWTNNTGELEHAR